MANLDRVSRMIRAAARLSDDVLHAHLARLYARRDRLVTGVLAAYQAGPSAGLVGALFDVTTDMQFACAHVVNERATFRHWAACRKVLP